MIFWNFENLAFKMTGLGSWTNSFFSLSVILRTLVYLLICATLYEAPQGSFYVCSNDVLWVFLYVHNIAEKRVLLYFALSISF